VVSISPKERERERERERKRKREREKERERDRVESMRRDARARRALPLVRSRWCRREKTRRQHARAVQVFGEIESPKERERERESPRNVRPRPRTLTVLYVNRSSFRSFKMLPKPMLSRRPKHPLFARKAHESNWCPSKGAL